MNGNEASDKGWGWLDASALPVAAIASGLSAATFVLLGLPVNDSVVLLSGLGAFLVYLTDRAWLKWPEDAVNRPQRAAWHEAHPWYRWIATPFVLGAMGWCIWRLPSAVLLAGAILAIPALLHMIPIPGMRVKAKPVGKPLVVASAWATGVVVLPLLSLEGGDPAHWLGSGAGLAAIGLWAMRFAAVAANVLVSDIHDLEGDTGSGLESLAGLLGPVRARKCAGAILGAALAVTVGLYLTTGQPLWLVDGSGFLVFGVLISPQAGRLASPFVLDALVGWPVVTVLAGLWMGQV